MTVSPLPRLIDRLLADPHSFDLFQAISLIERLHPQRRSVGAGVGRDEALRLGGQVQLGFSPSDIATLGPSDRPGPPLTLRSSALSLAGAQGPLPLAFTELLLARRGADDVAGLDFLDILHQRLLGLLHRHRRRHHLALQPSSWADAPLPRLADALSGLGRGLGVRGPGGERQWLAHAGLQGAAPRSLASLLALLAGRLGVRFQGRQFAGGWQSLAGPQQARLSSARLGADVSLGRRTWDQEAGIELEAHALDAPTFTSLLPGGCAHGLLGWLVGRHLQRDLRVVVSLGLAQRPLTRLGGGDLAPRLGHAAWLCGGNGSWQRTRFSLATGIGEGPHGH